MAALPATFHLGAHWLAVHEPRLEQGAGHRLQRFVRAPVEFDLVVERTEDVGDGALFFGVGRNPNPRLMQVIAI